MAGHDENHVWDCVVVDPWELWRQATCMPDHCFCEAIRYGEWIRQPTNTFTNISFMLAGLYIAYLQYYKKQPQKNHLTNSNALTYTYAASVFLVGAGSFFYHASLTFLGQFFDVMGMYLTITFFSLYNFARMKKWSDGNFILPFVLVNILLGLALYYIPEIRRYLFGVAIVIFLIIATITQKKMQSQIESKYLKWTLGSFAVAFGIWILDIKKIVCIPQSLFQGHGVWHFLCAVASFFLYQYYASEKLRES